MWFKQLHFNRRDWLLNNFNRLDINADQCLILMVIDAQNQLNEDITHELLQQHLNRSFKQIDKDLQVLIEKQYLKIRSYKRKIVFNIDGVFNKEFEDQMDKNELLHLFEDSFGRLLSQQELLTLSQLQNKVESDKIIYALRQAMIQSKLSMSYVERVALNESSKNEQ